MKALLLIAVFFCSTCLRAQTISLVKEFSAIASCDPIYQYAVLNNDLYFIYQNALWKTDGTDVGTVVIKQLKAIDRLSKLISFNNALYFFGDEGTGYTLWKSDGSVIGTHALGSNCEIIHRQQDFTIFKNNIVFTACNGVSGCELWISDGTHQGTRMIKDIDYGYLTFPITTCVVNNDLYFSQNDTFGLPNNKPKLWKTDGVSVTQLDTFYMSGKVFTLGNVLFFDGDDFSLPNSNSFGFYKYDIATGSHSLLYQNFHPLDYELLGDKILVVADSNYTAKVYSIDTFGNNREKLSDTVFSFTTKYYFNGNDPFKNYLLPFNNKFYLLKGAKNINADEIWETDGTKTGTIKLSIPPEITNINSLIVANSNIFFKAYDTINKRVDVWSMDINGDFTRYALSPAYSYTPGSPLKRGFLDGGLMHFNNKIYLTNLYDTVKDQEFYKIDLTPAGIEELNTGQINTYPNPALNEIHVDAQNIAFIFIYDITGKRILSSKQNSINITHLSPGIYHLNILFKDGSRKFAKFVKQ